jgi:hypothetical protein
MIIVRLLSPGLGWFAPPKFIPGLGAGIVMESIRVKEFETSGTVSAHSCGVALWL